jgi:transposase
MTRFVVGHDRSQSTLFPERLDDYLGEDNPVRAIDVFVDELDLAKLGLPPFIGLRGCLHQQSD